MASYNRIKALKSAPVGTIMPYGGISSPGSTPDALPKGWMVCDGKTLRADQYPLLAQILGNTYGPFPEPGQTVGIQNEYPYYTEDDLFNLPNFNQRALIDLEGTYLAPEDLSVVGQYISENGVDVSPPTQLTSYVDVNFSVEVSNNLSGRITGVTMTDPVYFDTFYVIPRKLGVDHMPEHTHPAPTTSPYTSADVGGRYVAVFEAGNYQTESGAWTTATSDGIGSEPAADTFNPGIATLTWYDPDAETLVLTDSFKFYNSDRNVAPLTTTRTIPGYANTQEYTDPGTAIANVRSTCVTGPIPVAGTYSGLKNYAGTDINTNQTYPVTLNHNAESFASNFLGSHNHFTVDVNMTRGQLGVPTTILVNDVGTGTISPVSVDRALNITVNPNTPSQTILYIIRAY